MNFDLIDFALIKGVNLVLMPAVILILAIILDWLCGDMRWLFNFIWHPVVFMGRLISFLDKRLNRGNRSAGNRMIRGLLTVIFVTGLSALVGHFILVILKDMPFAWLMEAFIVATLLAARSLYQHVCAVATALERYGIKRGREAVSHIVGRDPKALDKHGVARAAIESLAENFSDGIVAPLFWYLLLGLPGLFAYKAINTLDSMIGYKTKRYQDFGMIAARLDDVANWLPARLSGLLLVIAALFSTDANPFQAFRFIYKFAGLHASPNAGWPEAAMAGAFDFALGGPRKYLGGASETAWIGDGRARLEVKDIKRAGILYLIANLLILLGLAVHATLIRLN